MSGFRGRLPAAYSARSRTLSSIRAMRVALIGTGRMGTPIACRLRDAGHSVRVFDAEVAARDRLRDAGFEVSESINDAQSDRQAVLLCLPDAGAVRAVARELESAPLVIDLTSSLPSLTRSLALRIIDAPMSGGVAGAETGTLTLMVGGPAELVAEATPLLQSFAARIFHTGDLGSGHCVKALNNALSAVALTVTSEAVAAGRWAAHSPAGTIRRLNAGLGRTQNSEVKFPRDILSGRYASGFTARLMLKDLSTALAVAEAHGCAIPLVATVRELWQALVAALGPDADFTRIYEHNERMGAEARPVARCDLDHFDRAVAAACVVAADEMVAVAEADGVVQERFLEVVNESSGRSEATRHFEARLGFTREHAVRSLEAIRKVAAAGQPVPALGLTAELLKGGARWL